MLLTDCREEFLYDCQCRHLAKGTLRNYRAEINFLLEYLAAQGITDAAQVKPSHIRAFLKSKQDAGCKPAYINDLLKAHKCLFGYLADEGYIQEDISQKVKGVHQPKVVIETFTEQEVRRLLGYYSGADYLSVRNKMILALLFDTGARCNEMILMQLEAMSSLLRQYLISKSNAAAAHTGLGGVLRALLGFIMLNDIADFTVQNKAEGIQRFCGDR